MNRMGPESTWNYGVNRGESSEQAVDAPLKPFALVTERGVLERFATHAAALAALEEARRSTTGQVVIRKLG